MTLAELLKNLPIPLWVGSVIMLILSAIVILNSSKVERIFFSQQKNLIIQLLHIVLTAFFFTLLYIQGAEWITGESVINAKDIKHSLIIIAISYLFISIIVGQFYYILNSYYLGRDTYYIIDPKHGKLYLIKSINSKEVLLFNHPRLSERDYEDPTNNIFVFRSKESIKEGEIYQGEYTDSLFKSIRKTLNSIWEKIKK